MYETSEDKMMTIDNDQFELYRSAFPEDADRMSLACLAAKSHGMTEEFNFLLENSLDSGLRANWTHLLAACGRLPDHKYAFSLWLRSDVQTPVDRGF